MLAGLEFAVPELPEVEVLVRHLRPLLQGKTIRSVEVRRQRVLGKNDAAPFSWLAARAAALTE